MRGKPVKGSRILVLGLAYKPDVDDVRESPSFELIEKLEKLGADGRLQRSARARDAPDAPPRSGDAAACRSTPESLAGYDCVLIATHHSAYDWQLIADHAKLIIDTRNAMAKVRGKRDHIVPA